MEQGVVLGVVFIIVLLLNIVLLVRFWEMTSNVEKIRIEIKNLTQQDRPLPKMIIARREIVKQESGIDSKVQSVLFDAIHEKMCRAYIAQDETAMQEATISGARSFAEAHLEYPPTLAACSSLSAFRTYFVRV